MEMEQLVVNLFFFGVWTQDFYIYTIKHVPSVDQSSNFIHPKCLILAEAISMEAQAQSYQRHAQTDQENSNESENGEANYNCRWKGQCVFWLIHLYQFAVVSFPDFQASFSFVYIAKWYFCKRIYIYIVASFRAQVWRKLHETLCSIPPTIWWSFVQTPSTLYWCLFES